MTQIIALLNDLLLACQGVRALLQSVYNLVAHTAQENVPFHIATQVDITEAIVADATFGNQQINNNLLGLVTTVTADFDALTAQIAAMQAGLDAGTTIVVTSNGDANAVALAVWNYVDTFIGRRSIDLINLAAQTAIHKAAVDEYVRGSAFAWPWVVSGDWAFDAAPNPNTTNTFPLDFSTILASDLTAWDWANRTMNPDAGFYQNSDGLPSIDDFTSGNWVWTLYLPTLVWRDLQASLGLLSLSSTAPVWPGISNVTLGTPVALDLTLTVDGPMDGVVVAIDTYPTLKGQYTYGDMVSALKIGAITFVSDNGDAEFVQVLGFLNEVYCPKSMAHASSCKVRTVSGVTGTITPWTLA